MNYLNNLVCVLFHGPSGAGKTQTAKLIAAPEGVKAEKVRNHHNVFWDHRTLAAPLAEMHTIKTDILGANSDSRQLWMLHEVYTDLFRVNSIDFTEFIELIYDTQAYPLHLEEDVHGKTIKDRDFMTSTADACHKLYPNVFAERLRDSVIDDYKRIEKHRTQQDIPFKNIVIVSDLRLRPELEVFEDIGIEVITIRFDVTPEEQDMRLFARDGSVLTEEQKEHETQVSPFSDQDFDLILDSTANTLQQQVITVQDFITDTVLPA